MKNKKSQPEKPYSKPILRKIELKADEVLAVGCKTATGPSAVTDPITCVAGSCAGIGS